MTYPIKSTRSWLSHLSSNHYCVWKAHSCHITFTSRITNVQDSLHPMICNHAEHFLIHVALMPQHAMKVQLHMLTQQWSCGQMGRIPASHSWGPMFLCPYYSAVIQQHTAWATDKIIKLTSAPGRGECSASCSGHCNPSNQEKGRFGRFKTLSWKWGQRTEPCYWQNYPRIIPSDGTTKSSTTFCLSLPTAMPCHRNAC